MGLGEGLPPGLRLGRCLSVIASAIVSLGTSLSLNTVAEGIENSAQLRRLTELGCRRGQGYLFSRPLSPDDMSRRLAAAGQPA